MPWFAELDLDASPPTPKTQLLFSSSQAWQQPSLSRISRSPWPASLASSRAMSTSTTPMSASSTTSPTPYPPSARAAGCRRSRCRRPLRPVPLAHSVALELKHHQLLYTHGQDRLIGEQAQTSYEDCLSLAVWTPLPKQPVDRDGLLPVAIFVPGGDFQNGGIDITYQKPAPLVSRRQDLSVVTLQYRLDLFSLPHAAALQSLDQNLGLLDQCKAVEWLRSNIRSFGGDPENGLTNMRQSGCPNGSVHGGPMTRFAAGNKVHEIINLLDVDGTCFGQGTYNHIPWEVDKHTL